MAMSKQKTVWSAALYNPILYSTFSFSPTQVHTTFQRTQLELVS
jgi:hypothetical protein